MKSKILSAALALLLCASSLPMTAYASQEIPLTQKAVPVEESTSQLIPCDSTVPSPQEVYESMIALSEQDAYKEGTPWTNDVPYSSGNEYRWKGGLLGGHNIVAVGCVAFAFILSDTAFGNLPARMYEPGSFTFEEIKVGDILKVNNDVHTVIVLEVSDAGVVLAEGNYNSSVHWGRAMTKEDVMRDTSHYITRYPEGYIPPDDPTANDIIADGSLAAGLTWKLTKAGTLTVSGSGAMPDYSSADEQPWKDNSDKIRKVILEEGVTGIGSCAFWNCGVLSTEISSTVTSIGNSAFRGSSIVSVTIPSGVKTIGDSAFQACTNLSSVTVSEGVAVIGQNAFNACGSLTSIALPASIEEVGAAAFFQCQKLTIVSFAPGSNQVKMGDNLFTQCYYLMRVTLPKKIDRISNGMFQNCLGLAGVEIPQGAESIGDWAFASCQSLTTLIIPDSVRTIKTAAFSASSLSDIYYTGTESQWNSIGKIGDTAAAVSKVNIHYNYTPAPEETPSPTEKPEETPGPSESPEQTPTPTENPEQTPTPSENPEQPPVPSTEPTAAPPIEETPAPHPEGDLTYSNGNYYFYENGEMAASKEAFVNGQWRWFDADGTMAVDKDVYLADGGKWVRYNEKGEMIKGEDHRYGGWYYFDPTTGAMTKGPAILEDGRQVYYDAATGQMAKGTQNINGQTYYFDEVDGHLVKGENSKVWVQIDGKDFWYEDWKRQGYDPADGSYRGKEIYDPTSDAWYWLDSVQQGAKAVSKDVYQESYSAYPDREDGTGKWVRYDENGRMVKGWDNTEAGTYYFEEITGAMAKGHVTIEGREYYFDPVTGIRQN